MAKTKAKGQKRPPVEPKKPPLSPVASDPSRCGCGARKVRTFNILLCERNPHCLGEPLKQQHGYEIMTKDGYVPLGK